MTDALSTADQRAWLQLLHSPLGTPEIRRLVDAFGSADAAIGAGRRGWKRLSLSGAEQSALETPDEARLERDLAWLAGSGHELLAYTDKRYPQRLREISASPPALFCIGDVGLLDAPQLAIVGARSATAAGLENAQAFAEALASRGLVITSGLALGIDGAAHRGALAAGGGTIAVCGTGLDRVYPAQHRDLAHAIAGHGLLISEFLPGTPPKAEHFPRRNRLISGLALGVLVVEAARESGSLITARLAADQGREVFAIPGSIHNPLARGCHQLIRQGAKLVETVDDVFVELAGVLGSLLEHPDTEPKVGESKPFQLSIQTGNHALTNTLSDEISDRNAPIDTEPAHDLRVLLQALDDAPTAVDQLTERLGWSAERIGSALLEGELTGRLASDSVGRIMRLRQTSP